MTKRNELTGEIAISPGALREDLELTRIKAEPTSDYLFQYLQSALVGIRRVGVMLPAFSDASPQTMTTLAEAEEILTNIQVRLQAEEPERTFLETAHPTPS